MQDEICFWKQKMKRRKEHTEVFATKIRSRKTSDFMRNYYNTPVMSFVD